MIILESQTSTALIKSASTHTPLSFLQVMANVLRGLTKTAWVVGEFEVHHGSVLTQFIYTCGLMVLFAVGFKFEGEAERLLDNVGPQGDRSAIPNKWWHFRSAGVGRADVALDEVIQPAVTCGLHMLCERLEYREGQGREARLIRFIGTCVGPTASRFNQALKWVGEGLREEAADMRRLMPQLGCLRGEGGDATEDSRERALPQAVAKLMHVPMGGEDVDTINDISETALRLLAEEGKGISCKDFLVRGRSPRQLPVQSLNHAPLVSDRRSSDIFSLSDSTCGASRSILSRGS